MYWWLNAPVFATSALWALVLAFAVFLAPWCNWQRSAVLGIGMIGGVLLYIPACTGMMWIIDQERFGYFDYQNFGKIPTSRLRRLLPEVAKDIRIHQQRGCNRARYRISPVEFDLHLDTLWHEFGSRAYNSRATSRQATTAVELEALFFGLELPKSSQETEPFIHSGPTELSGYGAVFYLHAESGTVFQRTCYW